MKMLLAVSLNLFSCHYLHKFLGGCLLANQCQTGCDSVSNTCFALLSKEQRALGPSLAWAGADKFAKRSFLSR
jgi:hypothetical protein